MLFNSPQKVKDILCIPCNEQCETQPGNIKWGMEKKERTGQSCMSQEWKEKKISAK